MKTETYKVEVRQWSTVLKLGVEFKPAPTLKDRDIQLLKNVPEDAKLIKLVFLNSTEYKFNDPDIKPYQKELAFYSILKAPKITKIAEIFKNYHEISVRKGTSNTLHILLDLPDHIPDVYQFIRDIHKTFARDYIRMRMASETCIFIDLAKRQMIVYMDNYKDPKLPIYALYDLENIFNLKIVDYGVIPFNWQCEVVSAHIDDGSYNLIDLQDLENHNFSTINISSGLKNLIKISERPIRLPLSAIKDHVTWELT
jgi:hypothetical protein